MKCDKPICPQTLSFMMAGWFLLAVYAGESHFLALMPPAVIPALIAGITVLLVTAYFALRPFRRALDRIPDKAVVAVHLSRFVGIYFLFLGARGQLDPRFAVPAGWGDICVASTALALLTVRAPRWVLLAWNCGGLFDILWVVWKAATLRFQNPEALSALTQLPLSLLPTFLVPLIIASHIILFWRLLRNQERTDERAKVEKDALGAELSL